MGGFNVFFSVGLKSLIQRFTRRGHLEAALNNSYAPRPPCQVKSESESVCVCVCVCVCQREREAEEVGEGEKGAQRREIEGREPERGSERSRD